MMKKPILFGMILLLALPATALAQDSNRLSALSILVWPEYDTPTVLVQYDGMLADATNLPREIALLVPTGATIYATAYADAAGNLFDSGPWRVQDLGDGYSRLTYTTQQARFHAEYYYNPLQGTPAKTMTFVYQASAPADKVLLEIQQPLAASKFVLDPPTQKTGRDSQGFNYYNYEYQNVAAGQTIQVKISYTKTDPNPSVLPQPVASPAAAPREQTNVGQLAAIVLGLGLLAAIAFFLLRRRVPGQRKAPAVRRTPRGPAWPAASGGFCPRCGRTLAPDDNFCPKCGAQRRR